MKKLLTITIVAISLSALSQGTLRREIPTTSAFSRRALTNETAALWRTWLGIVGGTGTGTVTSVAISLPSEFVVSGSPVTESGTISALWQNQTANYVLSAPASGGAGTPTFRLLVAADVPSLDAAKTGSGVFSTARLGGGVANSGTVLSGGSGGVPAWVVQYASNSISSIGLSNYLDFTGKTVTNLTAGGTIYGSLTGTVAAAVIFTSNAIIGTTNNWSIYDPVAGQSILALYPGSGVNVGETAIDLVAQGPSVRVPGALVVGPGALTQAQGGGNQTNVATLTLKSYGSGSSSNQLSWQFYKNGDLSGSRLDLIHFDGNSGWTSNLSHTISFSTNDNVAVANTLTATNGVVYYQLGTFPTSSIPTASSGGTNWVQVNYQGIVRTLTTNYGAAGAYLKLVGETVSVFTP